MSKHDTEGFVVWDLALLKTAGEFSLVFWNLICVAPALAPRSHPADGIEQARVAEEFVLEL